MSNREKWTAHAMFPVKDAGVIAGLQRPTAAEAGVSSTSPAQGSGRKEGWRGRGR